jgi:hypothetical protein
MKTKKVTAKPAVKKEEYTHEFINNQTYTKYYNTKNRLHGVKESPGLLDNCGVSLIGTGSNIHSKEYLNYIFQNTGANRLLFDVVVPKAEQIEKWTKELGYSILFTANYPSKYKDDQELRMILVEVNIEHDEDDDYYDEDDD